MRRLSLLVLAAFVLQLGRAQTPAAPRTAYRVAGTIVSATDNHPLQRAKVQLLNPENQVPFESTTSDEYGHFAFTGVPAGNHELQGSAPNYIQAFYDDHDGFNTGIITGAGVDTESLVLKLRPDSTIAGSVVSEAAEPVQGALVHLFRESHKFGDTQVVSAATASTDDLGNFELTHLLPGDYYLAVTAGPWYAVHPQPEGTSANPTPAGFQRAFPQPPNAGVVDSIDPSLDVAYAATFYPGTTEAAHAAPIHIRGGDSVDVSLQLSPQPAVTLILPRSPQANGRPAGYPRLLSMSFRGQPLPPMGETRQTQTQTIVSGIAPGDYALTDGNSPFQQPGAGVPIHLSERITSATLPEPPAVAHIRVNVEAGHGVQLSPQTQVVLFVRSMPVVQASQFLDDKNQATLDVAPGDYTFGLSGNQLNVTVGKVIAGERTLPTNTVHLAAGAIASFTLSTLPRTNHTLKAIVRKDGKPCPGAFILLIPTSEVNDVGATHDFYRQQSDLDGSFDIPNLAPGDYTLLAIDGGWDVDWQQPAILAKYLPAAVAVHLPDTAEKTFNLAAPIPAQSR